MEPLNTLIEENLDALKQGEANRLMCFPAIQGRWLRRWGWPIVAASLVLLVAFYLLGVAQTPGVTQLLRSWESFDPAESPGTVGIAALATAALLAISTFVSEDLTCIGTGILVAQGRISFLLGAVACFFGIFVGDVLLFFAGRYFGRPVLKRAPLKWFVRARDVERSSAWFSRRGMAVIFTSRFVPGARLPTYFAAGLLDTSFRRFALYFLLAGLVWAPLLVGLSGAVGGEVLKSALVQGQTVFVKALATAFAVFVAVKLIVRLSNYKSRRLLLSKWRRLTRWEFWPASIFYAPVILYVALLALKRRSLTLFTSANPRIVAGGFVGESKSEILKGLSDSADLVARASLIESALDAEARRRRVRSFMTDNRLSFPVVLKPDMGQRGSGVAVVRSEAELNDYLGRTRVDTIVQEYVPGSEFGLFYYRRPSEERGRIFSITEKRFPIVTGDGASTLEHLILKDPRAVCMARYYFDKQGERLLDVPAEGEQVQLVEIGTHCRGAIFLDGARVKTAALEEAIDRVSKGFEGFYFGRFDVRAPSIDEFKRGTNFKIIELNGVTSEATHIYDPKNGLFAAYKVLFKQWRVAFEIGAENRARGVKPASIRLLVRLISEYKQSAQHHLR
jgi:membrane protein DedA with SNARE-associated domain